MYVEGNVSDVLLKFQQLINQYNTKELKPNRQGHERHARASPAHFLNNHT